MLEPNVGERDARIRQIAAGAGILFAATSVRKHPVAALAATVIAVDLAATAAARWCWALEMMGLDSRALDTSRRLEPQRPWGENRLGGKA